MSRRTRAKKREILPDPKFNEILVGKFVNHLMMHGKKSVAEAIVYEALEIVAQKTKEEGIKVFREALMNVRPAVEVRSRRVGGATYQVPVEVRDERSVTMAMRWLVSFARKRGGRTMVGKLSEEIIDAYNKRGGSFKKKEDTHRMAEANRAFAHYKW